MINSDLNVVHNFNTLSSPDRETLVIDMLDRGFLSSDQALELLTGNNSFLIKTLVEDSIGTYYDKV